jgi:hypothetical protein
LKAQTISSTDADADDITINTLQNVLFMDRVNDLSFKFREKQVVLIEHESTMSLPAAERGGVSCKRCLIDEARSGKEIYNTVWFNTKFL